MFLLTIVCIWYQWWTGWQP